MKNKLFKIIKDNGLIHISRKLMEEAKESIRVYTYAVDEKEIQLGASKIGGLPDLPKGMQWINTEGVPLSFIAQINMQDTRDYDYHKLLPGAGIIYFFYDCDDQPWGFDPADRDGWKVFYYDGDSSELVRSEPSSNEVVVFDACSLEFSREITLPPVDSGYLYKLGLNSLEGNIYDNLMDDIEELYKERDDRINRMLGHPDALQGDMQLECQIVTNGLYCGKVDAYSSPRRFELEKGAEDWILLFQLDSDENLQMMWGDDGRIYYWIKKQDLLTRNFDNIWLVLQCG